MVIWHDPTALSWPDPTAPVRDLSASDLQARLKGDEPLTLLDVREPSERAFCSISVRPPASELQIRMTEIPQRVGDIQAALARGPLVVYCHHGVRSSQVVGWLAEQGISGVLNLKGGIDAWSLEVDPSVRRYRLY